MARRFLSLLLAFLLLGTNLGLAVNAHFCGKVAVERTLSFGEEHLHCGMEQPAMASVDKSSCDTLLLTAACCHNQHDLLITEADSPAPQAQKLSLAATVAIAAVVHTFVAPLLAAGTRTGCFCSRLSSTSCCRPLCAAPALPSVETHCSCLR